MIPKYNLRDFSSEDAVALDNIAISAFEQYENEYADWAAMKQRLSQMSELSKDSEVIVAEVNGRIVGGVVYVGAGRPKPAHFDPTWPIIRMLVVGKEARGHGLGRALTEDCLRRGRRDKAPVIALHTSPMMTVALPMYLRMGFQFHHEAPPNCGAPCAVYTKAL